MSEKLDVFKVVSEYEVFVNCSGGCIWVKIKILQQGFDGSEFYYQLSRYHKDDRGASAEAMIYFANDMRSLLSEEEVLKDALAFHIDKFQDKDKSEWIISEHY
jgi:hypothetical protein